MNIDTGLSNTYEDRKPVVSCRSSVHFQIDNYYRFMKAEGKAICSPDDEFEFEFGRELARARAMQKLYKKYEKELIKYSYRNSGKNKKEYTKYITATELDLLARKISMKAIDMLIKKELI